MIRDGHVRNARTYELAYQNLERFIGTTKVMFSHLTSTVITRWISKYPLPELGHDVAMLILCLAGINTVDLYYAEKKYYHDGIIGYERRKTRDARKDNAWFE